MKLRYKSEQNMNRENAFEKLITVTNSWTSLNVSILTNVTCIEMLSIIGNSLIKKHYDKVPEKTETGREAKHPVE